jgi:hypothetical protein
MSKEAEIKTQKTMEKIVIMYGNERWAISEMNMKSLGTWDWKILREIFGPVVEQGM